MGRSVLGRYSYQGELPTPRSKEFFVGVLASQMNLFKFDLMLYLLRILFIGQQPFAHVNSLSARSPLSI